MKIFFTYRKETY